MTDLRPDIFLVAFIPIALLTALVFVMTSTPVGLGPHVHDLPVPGTPSALAKLQHSISNTWRDLTLCWIFYFCAIALVKGAAVLSLLHYHTSLQTISQSAHDYLAWSLKGLLFTVVLLLLISVVAVPVAYTNDALGFSSTMTQASNSAEKGGFKAMITGGNELIGSLCVLGSLNSAVSILLGGLGVAIFWGRYLETGFAWPEWCLAIVVFVLGIWYAFLQLRLCRLLTLSSFCAASIVLVSFFRRMDVSDFTCKFDALTTFWLTPGVSSPTPLLTVASELLLLTVTTFLLLFLPTLPCATTSIISRVTITPVAQLPNIACSDDTFRFSYATSPSSFRYSLPASPTSIYSFTYASTPFIPLPSLPVPLPTSYRLTHSMDGLPLQGVHGISRPPALVEAPLRSMKRSSLVEPHAPSLRLPIPPYTPPFASTTSPPAFAVPVRAATVRLTDREKRHQAWQIEWASFRKEVGLSVRDNSFRRSGLPGFVASPPVTTFPEEVESASADSAQTWSGEDVRKDSRAETPDSEILDEDFEFLKSEEGIMDEERRAEGGAGSEGIFIERGRDLQTLRGGGCLSC